MKLNARWALPVYPVLNDQSHWKMWKHSRISPDVQFKEFSLTKQKTRPRRDMNGLGKPFRKKSGPKIEKTVKIKVKLPHMNKKTTSEKANFCSNTFFSLYLKFRAKKFHPAKPLAFSLHFLFRRDQNHYSNLTSQIMKMCEQIFKKRRPNTIQILWIVKKHSAPTQFNFFEL